MFYELIFNIIYAKACMETLSSDYLQVLKHKNGVDDVIHELINLMIL